ncbi:adenosylcobalamin-dependent ribonucleoside-diphosphate reductase [Candidatus Nezhaarchaeota archaeon WYZ-LMO8]|nr:MAG: adenosylcobalamin-dependent ribonucleoside-diphosphate reductase [Candidatus Nezhaarchaeota archaeon WYZ-LMO8]TDA35987.1 MAG: adenosylcobalamin-dependent ribonucleoside-diphosphate reductase [Candidatus Nezhaarchaeota archaeon WYZ-LMO7]
MIEKVRKRDGRLEDFNSQKITNAIYKALRETSEGNYELAKKLSSEVVAFLNQKFSGKIPSVEEIQDVVEEVLIKHGLVNTAKAYILYRRWRTNIRETKRLLGVEDDLKLTINAVRILARRYLLRNEKGVIIETPGQMFSRVAKAIARAELFYGLDPERAEKCFFQVMRNLEFLPNSPTLMNAGTEMGQLAACFVLPVEDSIEGIFDALKYMAIIHKSGGGTGFSFSRLRPKGDIVKSTMGIASGPISFMKIFDVATEVIKQGGKRRGANMGVLRVDHPDIREFITSKSDGVSLRNFNISVAVTDRFMSAVESEGSIDLINPRTKEPVKTVSARDLLELMVDMAWRTGDPGLLFIDEINRKNPTPKLGEIEATNPCGEVPLLPFEACNLGSINLSKVVKNGDIDWDRLRELVWIGVHFLDNVIDVNKYPLPQIERMVKLNRKIGLGVMGFADMLLKLGIPYDSKEALDVADKVMGFIALEGKKASRELALERGVFPTFNESRWKAEGYDALRNATVTAIAPTGTISIIAGTSSSIEPIFAPVYVRRALGGVNLIEINPMFEKILRDKGLYSRDLIIKVAKSGSVREVPGIPEELKRLMATALDIDPEWHVKMQATFQKYVDNAVAKTVNLKHEASLDVVRRVFMLAYKLKCKGITVYRYGSKPEQVLYIGLEPGEEASISLSMEYLEQCPKGICFL